MVVANRLLNQGATVRYNGTFQAPEHINFGYDPGAGAINRFDIDGLPGIAEANQRLQDDENLKDGVSGFIQPW
jgi:hypothetical protein